MGWENSFLQISLLPVLRSSSLFVFSNKFKPTLQFGPFSILFLVFNVVNGHLFLYTQSRAVIYSFQKNFLFFIDWFDPCECLISFPKMLRLMSMYNLVACDSSAALWKKKLMVFAKIYGVRIEVLKIHKLLWFWTFHHSCSALISSSWQLWRTWLEFCKMGRCLMHLWYGIDGWSWGFFSGDLSY